MKITEVGKSRKIEIPVGKWICVTIDDELKDASGIILSSQTGYEILGVLTMKEDKEPEADCVTSFVLGRQEKSRILEIGPKVELWMKHASNTSEYVYVQEFK